MLEFTTNLLKKTIQLISILHYKTDIQYPQLKKTGTPNSTSNINNTKYIPTF